MNEIFSLSNLKEGETATVKKLRSTGSMRRRLQDIGLIEGTRVECLQKSPSGDPIAFLIRGAVIALRSEDSCNVVMSEN
jgi:ferrous iron transport protein A